MTTLRTTLLVGALLASSAALAEDCKALRAAHGDDAVYECILSYNDGSSAKVANDCFLSLDEGFAWMGKHSASTKGVIRAGNCHNREGTVHYVDWLRDRGLAVNPPREGKNPKSLVEETRDITEEAPAPVTTPR
ncbi:hypothetical protein [Acuticoccus mangrovi]|uniref:Uncharacterized protein n=1 Tax=Acuticoccus mangrovi TaxID=2796142 RepID=A0A934IUW3_9HYPH|nr:hypothetical protein [Acuticoccus mangrovi]MBJ3778582.1 hypothetical protein [Acuticoccus mangrovi]